MIAYEESDDLILKDSPEALADFSADVFVTADLLEDIGEDECCWALVVEQVRLTQCCLTSLSCCDLSGRPSQETVTGAHQLGLVRASGQPSQLTPDTLSPSSYTR